MNAMQRIKQRAKAMIRRLGVRILLASAVLLGGHLSGAPLEPTASAASSSVLLVEVYNGSQNTEEWVVLGNVGKTRVDLSGWKLTDYSGSGKPQGPWPFPNGTVIEPYSLLIVERAGGAAKAEGSGVKTIVGGAFNISQESDRLDLIDAQGKLVDGVAWGSGNNVENFSIRQSIGQMSSFERVSVQDTDRDADWHSPSPSTAWEWAPLGAIQIEGAPKALALNPANGETAVPLNGAITIEYDQKIVRGAGGITIANLSDDQPFLSVPVSDPSVTVGGENGRTLSFRPSSPLAAGKRYEVSIAPGAVQSESGVRSATQTWTFGTEVTAGSTVPPEGYRMELDIHASQPVLTGYNEAAPAGSVVAIYDAADRKRRVGTAQADAQGAFTLPMPAALTAKTVYVTARAAGLAESEAVPVTAKGVYVTKVVRISDGDTVVISPKILGSDRIRMLSVDTPEKAQGQHGDLSAGALAALIPPGTEIEVEPGVEPKDVYDRLLGHIFRKTDKLDVNLEMLREGRAVNYYIAPNMTYFETYSEATKEAKVAGRGIWDPSNPLEKLPYVYRFDGRTGPDKYVGDYFTKKFYAPDKWDKIDVEKRVFFFRNEAHEASNAGFVWADEGPDPTPQFTEKLTTIADARKNGGTVRLRGEVTASFPGDAWIQDATGGIRLYGGGSASLRVGDEIEIQGNVGAYQNDLELKDFFFKKQTGDAIPQPQPQPVALSEVSQAHEGKLLRVTNAWIKQDYDQADGGVMITDGKTDMIVYAYGGERLKTYLQSLPKGDKHKFDFVGAGTVYKETRQLAVRNPGDILRQTQDADAPRVLSQFPLHQATGVPLQVRPQLVFDEAVRKGQGVIIVRNVLSGTAFAVIPVDSEAVAVEGSGHSRVTVQLPRPLEAGRLYDVIVSAGAFTDEAGNPTVSETVWSFTASQSAGAGALKGTVAAQGRADQSGIRLTATDATGREWPIAPVVAADGSFTVTQAQLPAGTYRLTAVLAHYIPVSLEAVTLTEGRETDIGVLSAQAGGGSADGRMRAGDTTADGVIDIYDAAIVGKSMGQGSAAALAAADINGDGAVNGTDMELVRGNLPQPGQ